MSNLMIVKNLSLGLKYTLANFGWNYNFRIAAIVISIQMAETQIYVT